MHDIKTGDEACVGGFGAYVDAFIGSPSLCAGFEPCPGVDPVVSPGAIEFKTGAQANCKWLASEPVRFAFLKRGGKQAHSAPTPLGSLADIEPTVNTLTSGLPVVLDSKFAGWNAHASKGIADVSG
jgi:hypothetical protein